MLLEFAALLQCKVSWYAVLKVKFIMLLLLETNLHRFFYIHNIVSLILDAILDPQVLILWPSLSVDWRLKVTGLLLLGPDAFGKTCLKGSAYFI